MKKKRGKRKKKRKRRKKKKKTDLRLDQGYWGSEGANLRLMNADLRLGQGDLRAQGAVDHQTNALPDRPTNQRTDGHSQLQRCFGARKKKKYKAGYTTKEQLLAGGQGQYTDGYSAAQKKVLGSIKSHFKAIIRTF